MNNHYAEEAATAHLGGKGFHRSTGSQVFFATLPEKTHLASVHVSNG